MSRVTIDQAFAQAMQFHQSGRLAEAAQIYQQIIAAEPKHFDSIQLLGLVAHQLGQRDEAIGLHHRALLIAPHMHVVRGNLARILHEAGRFEEALVEADRVLAANPEAIDAWMIRAASLVTLERFDEAIAAWQQLIVRVPSRADVYANLGATLEKAKRFDEALAACERAVALNDTYAGGHLNLGSVLTELGRPQQAIPYFRRAIELSPNSAPAHLNLSHAALQLVWLEEAVAAAQRAVELAPSDPAAHRNLAAAYQELGQIEEASSAFETTVQLLEQRNHRGDPEIAASLRLAWATLLPPVYDSMEELNRCRADLIARFDRMKAEERMIHLDETPAPTLFGLAYHGKDDRAINETFASLIRAPQPTLKRRRKPGERIRIGFVSRFFKHHTIGLLSQGLVAELSREKFEVIVFSIGDAQDAVSQFYRTHADRFVPLTSSLRQIRQSLADAELDVLFYPDIGMDPATYSLAHLRFAPVQCVTWGHPVTTGIPTIDYFISADALEVADSESQYTEKLVKLKSLAVHYYRPTLTAAKSRSDFGLPEDATLYGCLQMLWKFHPEFDAIIADVLRRDPRGRLVLISGLSQRWNEKLLSRFRTAMPDVVDRVHFAARQDYANFLALTNLCDAMLDPLHFGGGNTTYEALGMGVPVIALPSQFLRGRISNALYEQMGMRDFIARDAAHYVEIAVAAANDKSLKPRVAEAANAIFENYSGVRELEAFLQQALQDASAGA